MLVRSSRRKLQYQSARNLQYAYDQLQLPWLCPAVHNIGNAQRRQSATSTTTDKPLPLTSFTTTRPAPKATHRSKDQLGRGFASPAISYALDAQDDYIPFESPRIVGQWDRPQSLTELRPWDQSNIREMPQEAQLSPTAYARKHGTSNEAEEMHAILDAHLHVGHFDRAASTLRRLEALCDISSPRLHGAYLSYLATLVSHLVVTKNEALWGTLRRWFNEDYRAKGLKATPTMITLLVQAGLRGPKQNKISRVIRHFLHLAEKDDVLIESLAEIEASLSEEEFQRIKEAAPLYFETMEADAAHPSNFVPPGEGRTKILPTPQKGKGLTTLHSALQSFYKASMHPRQIDESSSKDLNPGVIRQLRIEEDVIQAAMERWEADSATMMQRANANEAMSKRQTGALAWKWLESLAPAIKDSLVDEVAITSGQRTHEGSTASVYKALLPYLQHISPRTLAAITIMSVVESTVRGAGKESVPILRVVSQIGRNIQDECTAQLLKFRNREWLTRHRKSHKQRTRKLFSLVRDERRAPAERLYEDVLPSGENEWTTATSVKVGGFFLHLLMQAAYVDVAPSKSDSRTQDLESHPAFKRENILRKGHWVSVLALHPQFRDLLKSAPPLEMKSKHLPMLMEPIPWTGWKRGGYLQQNVPVVRWTTTNTETRNYTKLAIEKGDMDQIFAGLDVLGRTPWRINKPVLEVMTQAWNTGEAFANFPATDPQFSYPLEPTDMTDKRARKKYVFECKRIDDEREGMHSNRCFVNFQLEVARAYADDIFHLPHNMDFRGRAYPIPPYLNHMGADHCRGLLQFGRGRELGENGLRWLKIHLANVYGYDKASLAEREDFAVNHLEHIRDSATNPMDGQRWWLTADKPWQCLGACLEMVQAIDSPDPSKFVSYFPVHQDGTCNGLQHYAALGGDKLGAAQVNLEPGNRPADIYTAVANMVQDFVTKDVAEGNEIARLLDGQIKRKIVKQTVMTNVYGVTMQGAKEQIRRQLDDHYPGLFNDLPLGSFSAATYLARKVFQAVETMFNGAHEIQYWLGECAGRICKSLSLQQIRHIEENIDRLLEEPKPMQRLRENAKLGEEETRLRSPVVWTTPLRMPVVQPYRTGVAKAVKANFMSLMVKDSTPKDPISARKQVTAFPPNFIHSLDATHMLLSALKCDEQGLCFAAVHDSFWTHAADVDSLNNTLRDAFITMHSEDIVGRLGAEMAARYKGSMHLTSVPRFSKAGARLAQLPGVKGQPYLNRVKLRKQFLQDLLQERQRLRLLESEDALELEQGKAMVTPASLVSEAPSEDLVYRFEDDNLNRCLRNHPPDIRDAVIARFKEECKARQGTADRQVPAPDELLDINEMNEGDHSAVESDGDDTLDAIDVVHRADEAGRSGKDTVINESESTPEDIARQRLETKLLNRLRSRRSVKLWVWQPLVIPPVPKKGDFDVTRINESKYFFS